MLLMELSMLSVAITDLFFSVPDTMQNTGVFYK